MGAWTVPPGGQPVDYGPSALVPWAQGLVIARINNRGVYCQGGSSEILQTVNLHRDCCPGEIGNAPNGVTLDHTDMRALVWPAHKIRGILKLHSHAGGAGQATVYARQILADGSGWTDSNDKWEATGDNQVIAREATVYTPRFQMMIDTDGDWSDLTISFEAYLVAM